MKYNLGTGKARTFFDLAYNTFKVDEYRWKYWIYWYSSRYPGQISQYFTQASMEKLKNIGYDEKFYSLEEGIEDYVKNYLQKEKYL